MSTTLGLTKMTNGFVHRVIETTTVFVKTAVGMVVMEMILTRMLLIPMSRTTLQNNGVKYCINRV